MLIASIALWQALAAVAGCAWNSWMRDLVPEGAYGRFFGRRAAANTAVAMALALVCGILIDRWRRFTPDHAIAAYIGLFLVSAAIGMLGVWLLSITPDQPMSPLAARTARPRHAGGAVPRQELPPADRVPRRHGASRPISRRRSSPSTC